MPMMPSPRKPGNGRVSTPRVPGKPVNGPRQVVGPPKMVASRPGNTSVPRGYIRVKDGKGGFKIIKAKPNTVYAMSKPSVGKATRKPR